MRCGGLVGVVVVGICLADSGCVLLPVGSKTGLTNPLRDVAVRTYSQPVRVTAQSVVVALHRMGIKAKKSQIDDFGGTIHAETADGDSVHIRIDPEGSGSAVSIRVGTFQDEKKASALFARLEEVLPKTEPASAGQLPSANAATADSPTPDGPIVLPGESTFAPNAPLPPIPRHR